MTQNEAKRNYGRNDGYVSCMNCPIYEGYTTKCALLREEIPDKIANGRDDCWELIAKVMTERETESTKRETESAVDHPSHYAGAKFECIEVMLEVFGADAVKDFCLCNAFKYLWRCQKKHDNAVTDIKKAKFYLEKYIELEEGEANMNGK